MKINPPRTGIDEFDQLTFKERRRFQSWRQKGHFYFDKFWEEGYMSRGDAYKWLRDELGISREEAHFSRLSDEQCKKIVWRCQQVLNDLRRLDLDFDVDPSTPFYIL